MVEMVPELAIYCKQIGDFLIGIRDTLSSNCLKQRQRSTEKHFAESLEEEREEGLY